jgi:ribonuclease P protein component
MTALRETFNKSERLCNRKTIIQLLKDGNVFYISFYKVIWDLTVREMPFPAQVAFSVPKRSFRKAVIRNLLKRRMREAYRKQKQILYKYLINENIRLVFVVIFKDDKVPDYHTVEKSMQELCSRLRREAGKKVSQC